MNTCRAPCRWTGSKAMSMRSLRLPHIGSTELWLMVVIALMCLFLALTTDTFFTLVNLFDLLNISAVNVIFAAGLLVVLIAGGIDISFAVAASVVQYLTALTVDHLGGGNWGVGVLGGGFFGFWLGAGGATLVWRVPVIFLVLCP